MDNLKVALPSTSSSDSIQVYTFQNPYPQAFSIPYPIIKYIIQNPQSGKAWKKLIQTCKYFYSKYPVFPVCFMRVANFSRGLTPTEPDSDASMSDDDGDDSDMDYSDDDSDNDSVMDTSPVEHPLNYKADGETFNPHSIFPKLWLYDTLHSCYETNLSSFIPKIFKFELRTLILDEHKLNWNDYQALISSGTIEKMYFRNCTIKNGDGSFVTLDKILKRLNSIKSFEMSCLNNMNIFKADTVQKMVEHISGFKELRRFELVGITEAFDFNSFKEFLMKNKKVDVDLFFSPPVSDAFKEMIYTVIEEIMKNRRLNVPGIYFSD